MTNLSAGVCIPFRTFSGVSVCEHCELLFLCAVFKYLAPSSDEVAGGSRCEGGRVFQNLAPALGVSNLIFCRSASEGHS